MRAWGKGAREVSTLARAAMPKVPVLPVPLWASATTSLPASRGPMARLWIWVGASHPMLSTPLCRASGRPILSQVSRAATGPPRGRGGGRAGVALALVLVVELALMPPLRRSTRCRVDSFWML
jgi:hypothetical protein